MTTQAFRPRDCRSFVAFVICAVFLHMAMAGPASGEVAALDLSTLERIEVEPKQLDLRSPRDQAIVLVTGFFPEERVADLSRDAEATSSDPAVAEFRGAA